MADLYTSVLSHNKKNGNSHQRNFQDSLSNWINNSPSKPSFCIFILLCYVAGEPLSQHVLYLQQEALERDMVMFIHSQNRISQLMKGDSGESDPIKVCQFHFTVFKSSLFTLPQLTAALSWETRWNQLPVSLSGVAFCLAMQGWHEGPLPLPHPLQHTAHWA